MDISEDASKKRSREGCKVKVVVRCRPKANSKEKMKDSVIMCSPSTVSIQGPRVPPHFKKTFTFDHVFDMDSTQADVYTTTVSPIVKEVLEGYNCTVFAYGQTGTGKTYTMEGGSFQTIAGSGPTGGLVLDNSGVIPRAVQEIFRHLEGCKSDYNVLVSHLEIYNEELTDLLTQSSETKLKLCQDMKNPGNVTVSNLEEVRVLSASDIFRVLARGQEKRQVGETKCNKYSSRSHCIFTIKILIKEYQGATGEELVKVGKLNLVDLAGSENIGRSGASGKQAHEAGKINKSLLTLGKVITALTEGSPHIPYRESKLTRLLQESLGGRAKTCIIATVSPTQDSLDETTSTLEYAHRARNIQNKPQANLTVSKKVMMQEIHEELERMREQLQEQYSKNGVYMKEDEYREMKGSLEALREAEKLLQLQLESRERDQEQLKKVLEETCATLNATREDLRSTEECLQSTRDELTRREDELQSEVQKVEEREYLLSLHREREERLIGEAKELSFTIEKTTAHISSLEEKVSRQDAVIEENKKQSTRFRSELFEKLKEVESQLEGEQKRQSSSHSLIREGALATAADIKDALSSLQSKCEEMQSQLQSDFGSLSLSLSRTAQGVERGVGEAEVSAVDFVSTLLEREEKSVSANVQAIESFQAHVASLLTSTVQWQSEMAKFAEEQTKANEREREREREHWERVLQKVGDVIVNTSVALRSRDIMIESWMEEDEGSVKELKSSLLSKIGDVLDHYLSQKAESRSDRMKTQKDNTEMHVNTLEVASSEISRTFSSSLSNANAAKEEDAQRSRDREAAFSLRHSDVLCSFDSATKQSSSLSSSLSSHRDESFSLFSSFTDQFSSKTAGIRRHLEVEKASHSAVSEKANAYLSERHALIHSDLSSVTDRVGQSFQSIASSSDETSHKSTSASQETCKLVSASKDSLVSFQSKYKENEVSGLTPKKTRYPAPRVSSPLSSHSDLLREYRNLKRARESSGEEGGDVDMEDAEVTIGQSLSLSLSPSISLLSPVSADGDNPKKRVKRSPMVEEEKVPLQKENVRPSAPVKQTSAGAGVAAAKKPSSLIRKPSALRNITNVSKS